MKVADITRRVRIIPDTKNSPYNFYPYDIKAHMRSDQIAEYYYENSYLDWMIYLSNEIVDPYYDWYIRDDQLDELIKSKYGTTEKAKKKIKYFQNNWFVNADEQISTQYYESNLDQNLKKYYDPVFTDNNKIMFYKRKRIDETVNTNKVVDYAITYTNGSAFNSGELVDIFVPGSQIGVGEVVFSNTSVVRLQSVLGNTIANTTTNTYIVGEDSGTNAAASSSNTRITNISDEEYSFWTPIYFYDYEVAKNEENRTINLVNAQLVPFLMNDFVKLMGNT